MSSSTPPLSELDPLLASLNELKAPGANKSKIATITAICVRNSASEQQIVQSFYRAVKKAPATHKLGALYVIDSVIRQWTDKAKKAGQDVPVEGRPDPGTHAAGLRRIAELMPALLDDTLKVMPNEQIAKLANLIDIWDRGNFFPRKVISEFKDKMSVAALSSSRGAETAKTGKFKAAIPTRPIQTPLGMPPQHLYDRGLLPQNGMQRSTSGIQPVQSPPKPAAPQQDVNNILAALAASAPKIQAPPPMPAPPPSAPSTAGVPANILALLAQQAPPPAQAYPQQPAMPQAAPPPFNPAAFAMPPAPPAYQPPPAFTMPPAPAQDPLAPLRGILPNHILNDPSKLMQALTLLQDLQAGGIPMDQWAPVIQAFSEQADAREPAQNGRGRSRSPDRQGRGSPGGYNSYDERSRYRQRSPVRNSPVPAPGMAWNGMPMQPKIIHMDQSLPRDNIKVLSRTLFIGGANGSQSEIEQLFSRFGRVQTVIANRDKRHAFVKMTTRQSALDAKAGMEQLQSSNDREAMNVARQTKWGVGFGPRECCDYQRGESTIPIHKLTDADIKWLLSAEYGGSGGRELVGGMVLEEPDIEIGAGVSSKAMSRRVGPDGIHAKKEKRQHRGHGGRGSREDAQMGGMPVDHHAFARPEPVAVATPPAVPGFGFVLPGQ